MYKKQMTFQRIVCFAVLIGAALVFVYSLGFVTDIYEGLYKCFDPELFDIEYIEENGIDLDTLSPLELMLYGIYVKGADLFYEIQPFNMELTVAGLILVLVSLTLFITCTHSRRKYYIGNFIATALCTVANVAASVWAFVQLDKYKELYLQVDFEGLKTYTEQKNYEYIESTFWFDLGNVVFGVLLVLTALLIVNLILKLIVMKGEKSLIGSRKEERA